MRLTDFKFSPRVKIVCHDVAAVVLAWLAAWLTRFNFQLPEDPYFDSGLYSLPIVIVIQTVILLRFGLYRGLWRFASLPDLWNIVRASLLGAVLVGIALFLVNRLEGVPRSVLIIYPVFLVFFLGGPRLLYRVWKDHGLNLRIRPNALRALVIGAGNGGEMVVRDMLREGSFVPVGLVDDDTTLVQSNIHGIPVVGTLDNIQEAIEKHDVQISVIAIPSANNAQMRRIVDICERIDVPFRTLPQLNDLRSTDASVDTLREVRLEDLLGRDKIELDWQAIQSAIGGKVVLISGGGGSIGSELCRQIASLGASNLVIFDNSEHNLYLIEQELRKYNPNLFFQCVLGDVADNAAVEHVFAHYHPDLVFHAAAYKHVPILQHQTREALRVNVVGTRVMVAAAERNECDAFVLISTDKAVRPSSVMGASKRLAELVCESRNKNKKTRLITVRFGNVLGSAGSVVPLFKQQIESGGPVTVTHRDAERYFMTIPEACQLIMQAGSVGQGGEIFVLDMGEPIKIAYLAEQLIRLSGLTPGLDIEIVFTGLRPGEKLTEVLFYEDERPRPTTYDKLMLAGHAAINATEIEEHVEALEAAIASYDLNEMQTRLKSVIPDLEPSGLRTAGGQSADVISISGSAS